MKFLRTAAIILSVGSLSLAINTLILSLETRQVHMPQLWATLVGVILLGFVALLIVRKNKQT